MSPQRPPRSRSIPVVLPVCHASTHVFDDAQSMEAAFADFHRTAETGGTDIYGRLGNPNEHAFCRSFAALEHAESAALFASGMAAISSAIMAFVDCGRHVVFSSPVYGGTHQLLRDTLRRFGISSDSFPVDMNPNDFRNFLLSHPERERIAAVFIETPSNPTLRVANVRGLCREIVGIFPEIRKPVVIVDNTILGPILHNPLDCGADLVVHSATKSIGGHSDLLAGVVAGSRSMVARVVALRTVFGGIASAETAQMLTRSLATLELRVLKAQANARSVVAFLRNHRKVRWVYYPGFDGNDEMISGYNTQCRGSGSLLSFEVMGGKKNAFAVLNALRHFSLAVSMGSVESLAEHPRSTTHSGMSDDELDAAGISEGLIRLSVGIESSAEPLIRDLEQALEAT
jgi:methionine-gamma-lyase